MIKFNPKTLYNLNRRERRVITASVLILVGFLLYSFMIPPAWVRCRTAVRRFTAERHLIRSREQKLKNLLRLQAQFAEMQKKMIEKKNAFFIGEEAEIFLKELDYLVRQAGASLGGIKPREVVELSDSALDEGEDSWYKKHIVEVSVYGRYNDIMKFLKKCADYRKHIGVNRVDIKRVAGDPRLLSAQFELHLYTLEKK